MPAALAHAHRKLGTIDLYAGRRDRAEAWFASADELAAGDDDERSSIAGWRAANLTDMGRYADARAQYALSLELARRCGNHRQVSWSEGGLGRIHLLRGHLGEAADTFEASLTIARNERWAAFLPYPQALRAEVHRRSGALAAARDLLTHAHALAVLVKDPCWEGLAARGLGLIEADEGNVVGARRWLNAAGQCTSVAAEIWPWVTTFIREAHCELCLELGQPDVLGVEADRLLMLATRAEMPEVIVRAQVYRHLAGRSGALQAAHIAASQLDNTELVGLVEGRRHV